MGLTTTLCVIAVVVGGVLAQRRPPNYSLDEMPDIQTSFSCYDKILGGYYSDPETDCQMFHVCVRVAGVGVQDFRFLCPNDTAFDQENQICDDWYNIDCEASTLFYSDNFDLFRLGHNDDFAPVKATPIPLGPSGAPRIAPHPKPHRPHAPINNAVGENDDDLYLQRADAGDKRVSQDLLRGSSSSNFFSNRNKGKEDPDDDYVAPSAVKEQELIKNKKKNKNQVRKLLTGKRPVTQAPTEAPTTTTTVYYNRYNTVQRNRPTTTTSENYPSTAAPAQNYNNNYNNQRYNNNQQPSTAAPAQNYNNNYNNQRFNNNQQPSTAAPVQNYNNQRFNNNQQPSTAAPAQNYNNQRFNNNNQQTSTAAPAQSFNNYNNQRFNNNQQPSTPQDFNSQRIRGNQNFAFNKKPVASTNLAQEATTIAASALNNYNQNNNFRGNNYYQQTSTAAPAYSQTYYQTQSTTAAPTNYKTNYNQGNNYYQTTTTVAPQYNNYNQQTSTPASTVYNAYQNRASQQSTTNFNNNYQQQNTNNYQAYNSPSTVNTNTNYDATTLKQNYYQKQTTVNYDNYYRTSTNTPVVAYSTTFAPDTQKYNYDNSANVYQQTKNQYNYNVNAAGTTTVNYNPYSSYKGNDNYDEPSQGESLKTAPSSNIRPSDLNAIAKSYQKPVGGFNATLSAGYNFANPATTQKPTSKFYSSPKQFQTTLKAQTTVKPFQQSPTTYQPPSRGTAYRAQSSTAASPQPRPFSKAPAPEGTVAPKALVTKEKDASYDYAYYDEGTGSEYDGIDTIGEEFSRTTSHKGSRTTPQ